MMSSMASPTPPLLTSFANPRVKAATALRDRRERDRAGLTLVDGAREVRRALDAGVDVVEAFVCEPLLAGPDARAALDLLRDRDVPVQATSEAVFAKLAFGERAEGLLVVVRIPSTALADIALPDDPLVAVIEGVEKPGNVGAVLRSADGAGVDAVVAASPGPTCSIRTRSGPAPERCSRCRPVRRRRPRSSPGCAIAACASSRRGSVPAVPTPRPT